MPRPVDQRPKLTGARGLVCGAAEQPGTDSEQQLPTLLQAVRGCLAQWRGPEHRQPGIFQLNKLMTGHSARQELGDNRRQSWLGRAFIAVVELVELLAPPSQPDRA